MLGKLDTAVGAAAEQGAEAGNTQAPRETAAMLLRGTGLLRRGTLLSNAHLPVS